MKYLFLLSFLWVAFSSHAQHPKDDHAKKMQLFMHQFDHSDTIRIGVLAYNGMVLQDFAGPIEVFSKAKNLTNNHYAVFIIGLDKHTVSTENGLVNISPQYILSNMPACDYFIIPGAPMMLVDSLIKENNFQNEWMRWKKRSDTSRLVSICTASYFLAEKGLLDNKKATTHFFIADNFAQKFPKVILQKDVRFVDSGDILTSSGVTSGIDLALYIVGKINGEKIQSMITRALQYDDHTHEKWPTIPMDMRPE